MHSKNNVIRNLREQRKRLAGELLIADGKLEAVKKIWVEHRACSGDCEACDTVDWCLFLELRGLTFGEKVNEGR